MEQKMAALEKRLAEEREKVLLVNLKNQSEAATAARVEVSIKELQDRLRRDRRDQEQEENKHKLETKAQELESRLAQERETWVTTLKTQMQARESQDKELETHFALRLQEMERRWLEEKAVWQKTTLAKDEEIRNLRTLAEKLKGADGELSRVSSEKKMLEGRVAELNQDKAEASAKLQIAADKERESIQLRADLTLSRQQYTLIQERLERDLQTVRGSAREREERLLSDQERLSRELQSLSERLRVEHDSEMRRVKLESGAESARYKEAAERSQGELQKMRTVCVALERQAAAGRTQLEELRRSSAEWEKAQERYKAEFVVLQRKWVEREKEIRTEAAAQGAQLLDAEKVRIKLQAQEEINQRASRIAEQFQKEKEIELRQKEAELRSEIETKTAARFQEMTQNLEKSRAEMQGELERIHKESIRKDSEWSQRLLAKEGDLVTARAQLDDTARRLAREEDARQRLAAEKLEAEKSGQTAREDIGALRADLAGVKDRLTVEEELAKSLAAEKEKLERLVTAQSAQVQSSQESVDHLRGEVAREMHIARMYLDEKQKLLKELAELKRRDESDLRPGA